MAMPQPYRPNLDRFLARLTSRSLLSDRERQAILDLPAHAAQVQANCDFIALGECVEHACLVVDGVVGRFGQNAEGARQITSMHIAGDMPDLHSVVQPHSSSGFQALCTSTIVRVPHVSLRLAAGRFPAIAEAFWRDCMVEASILSEWVVNVGRRGARARTAHLLCEMGSRYGARQANAALFPLHITQAHLSDALGLTTVHVNRTLKALRDEHLVTFRSHMVHIPDWDRLAAVGDFDSAYLHPSVEPEQRLRLVPAC
jgi:CRP-like cAMP-binding protein